MKDQIINTFNKFQSEIDELNRLVSLKEDERIKWVRDNKKDIVNYLYPEKGKLYEIIDVLNSCPELYLWNHRDDSIYYFKPTNTQIRPHLDFGRNNYKYPVVKGYVYDSNLKSVTNYRDDASFEVKIFVNHLVDIDENNRPETTGNRFTKVYIMIDKSTGYYKIGRSIKPAHRERTLQSEKPTIELIRHFDAKVKDEKAIHNMFYDKRIRGEWFDLSGSDIEKIVDYFNRQSELIVYSK